MSFVHLHVHSEYSLLDGSSRVKILPKKAKELGMNSIALTDHGVMFGIIDFYKACKSEGIKPILGCEIYVAPRSLTLKEGKQDAANYHLILLAKSNEGYKNLMKIDSLAYVDGFYYRPRIDHENLRKYSKDIIALSACLGGEVQQHILKDNYEEAKNKALLYEDIFGKGNFFLELQDHGIEDQKKVNEALLKLSKEIDIPLVATNDVHYIEKDDSKAHGILVCIQTGKTVDDPDRLEFSSNEFYLKSEEEMRGLFPEVDSAIENTQKIADMCNVEFDFNVTHLPEFHTPKEFESGGAYLRYLCTEGLNRLYENVTDVERDRLNYELSVIEEMGYVDYFLIVWDFIRFAKERDIVTGPGRGSGAGSIVAYTLGITKIDPIKYNLIFERFLNPERISMPDIDSDFCYERRQEVIDYVVEKYGSERVAQIVTFGTMAAKAAIRDVGRALNYSYAEVDKIAKMIPTELYMTIDKALNINKELKAEYDSDERIKTLIDISKSLEGLPRHSSTHAAGVVISKEDLTNYVPVAKNDNTVVTQFPMGTLEELGLLKMDFLGLRTLTVLRDAVDLIKKSTGKEIDLDNLDFDDSSVYEIISKGQTEGIFQLESRGMMNFMKELKPDSLEDIIAGISLYRPGPMDEIPTYIKNKNNPSEVKYLDEKLRPILDVTYGVMVYQEQVMQIVRDIGGYSLGRSDLVRRAMSKKKHDVMEEERKNFIYGLEEDGKVVIDGAIRRGVSEEVANKLFDLMMEFASYAFNKSHAAAYAVVGYQTAYLRRYYPVEYFSALLTSVMGNNEKVAFYIEACRKIGIEVLPPDINESYVNFSVSGDKIRFGLAAVKNVGKGAIESIIETREKIGNFMSFTHFCKKADFTHINKRAVESMIKSGAFDNFSSSRATLLEVYEKAIDGSISDRKNNIEGQISLFGGMTGQSDEDIYKDDFKEAKEFSKRDILSMEKEMIGLYISGHPIDEYQETIDIHSNCKISDIIHATDEEEEIEADFKDGQAVKLGAIISGVNIKTTRKNDIMAFIQLEDRLGSIEGVVFPRIYQKLSRYIYEDNIIFISGKLAVREDEAPKILIDDVSPVSPSSKSGKLFIKVDYNKWNDIRDNIVTIFRRYKGLSPIVIVLEDNETGKKTPLKAKGDLKVDITEELLLELTLKLGEENLKVVPDSEEKFKVNV